MSTLKPTDFPIGHPIYFGRAHFEVVGVVTGHADDAVIALVRELGTDMPPAEKRISYLAGLRRISLTELATRLAGERALPDIEEVSAQVHESWMASKRSQGISSRKSEDGEELMVPYEQLSEKAKDLDRMTVRAVYAAIEACESHE